jgi:hypothetical protein
VLYLLPLLLLAPGPAPAAVGPLIEALADPDFARRERASRRLAAVGEAAVPALRRAAEAHPDAEVRRRARLLLAASDALPRGPLLRNAPPACVDAALAWYQSGLISLEAARIHAVTARQPVGPPPSDEECWEEATRLMAQEMLEWGCERRRVRRVLEALGRATPRAGPPLLPRHGRPAETLARLEAALGLK